MLSLCNKFCFRVFIKGFELENSDAEEIKLLEDQIA